MKQTKQFTNLNKRRIGKWTLNDQRKIRKLEDELKSFSFKTCNLVLQGNSSWIWFETVYNKIVKKHSKIEAIKKKYAIYRFTGDQNYEFC